MKKNWKLVTAIVAVVVVAGIVFYACKKDSHESLEIDAINSKVEKDAANDLLSIDELSEKTGIDIIELCKKDFFENYYNKCNNFQEKMITHTEEELAQLDELNTSMQIASSNSDFQKVENYFNEYLCVFYRTDNADYGMKIFDNFQSASVNFFDEMSAAYPIFQKLSEEMKINVLSTGFLYLRIYNLPQQPKTNNCGLYKQRAQERAAGTYAASVAVCGIFSPTIIGGAICLAAASASYATSLYFANKDYNECMQANG